MCFSLLYIGRDGYRPMCCGSGSGTARIRHLKSPPGSESAWTDADPDPGGKKA